MGYLPQSLFDVCIFKALKILIFDIFSLEFELTGLKTGM